MKKRGKKINLEIQERTRRFYKTHPELCRYHNWLARLYVYVRLGKTVYPKPKPKEVRQYLKLSGLPSLYKNEKRNFNRDGKENIDREQD